MRHVRVPRPRRDKRVEGRGTQVDRPGSHRLAPRSLVTLLVARCGPRLWLCPVVAPCGEGGLQRRRHATHCLSFSGVLQCFPIGIKCKLRTPAVGTCEENLARSPPPHDAFWALCSENSELQFFALLRGTTRSFALGYFLFYLTLTEVKLHLEFSLPFCHIMSFWPLRKRSAGNRQRVRPL